MTLSTQLTSDLPTYFADDDFGVVALYSALVDAGTHPGSATSIKGIFENEFVELNGMGAVRPLFTCATSDVSDASDGAKITIDSTVSTVRSPQTDGTGVTTLILEE